MNKNIAVFDSLKVRTINQILSHIYHVDFEKRGGCGVVARERPF